MVLMAMLGSVDRRAINAGRCINIAWVVEAGSVSLSLVVKEGTMVKGDEDEGREASP